MAKKKTVTKKKTSAAKKKPASSKKKPAAVKKKAVTRKKSAVQAQNFASNEEHHLALAAKHGTDARKLLPSGIADEYRISLLPVSQLENIREAVQEAMDDFQALADNNLTPIQRRRKIGAGTRNYGFIEKVADLSDANPQFAQFFDPSDLRNALLNFDECRNIALLLQSFARLVTNTMLIYSNEGYTMSSIFYNAVKTMSRRGDPTANILYNTLRPFFHRTKRMSDEPTRRQLDRDIHAIEDGTKEGRIVIENIAPKLTGGSRKIIDDVHNGRLSIKRRDNFEEKE